MQYSCEQTNYSYQYFGGNSSEELKSKLIVFIQRAVLTNNFWFQKCALELSVVASSIKIKGKRMKNLTIYIYLIKMCQNHGEKKSL